MSQTVGIDYVRVALLKDDDTVDTSHKEFGPNGIWTGDQHTAQGITQANISGLGTSLTKIFGSDTVVATSGQGAQPSATIGANDLPEDIGNILVGMEKDESGAYYIDDQTRPPMAVLEMVSHDRHKNKVHFAILKGQFTRSDQNMQTNTEQEQRTTDQLTFTGVSRKDNKRIFTVLHEGMQDADPVKFEQSVFPMSQAAIGAGDDAKKYGASDNTDNNN